MAIRNSPAGSNPIHISSCAIPDGIPTISSMKITVSIMARVDGLFKYSFMYVVYGVTV